MLHRRLRAPFSATNRLRGTTPATRRFSRPSNAAPADLSSPAAEALRTFAKYIQFSLIGAVGLAVTSFTVFEGCHIWVEKSSLALPASNDDEVNRWEWTLDYLEREQGGTDPALGWKAQHCVRAAWMALNWGMSDQSTSAWKQTSPTHPHFAVHDTSLLLAEAFLSKAIDTARQKLPRLRPWTMRDLLSRYASVLERMGTKDSLLTSRSIWEEIWAALPVSSPGAAPIAKKLGDINARLRDTDEARAWWARAIQITSSGDYDSTVLVPAIPTSAPTSPFAQRILISTLVSVSSSYSTTGHLREARAIQEASLTLAQSFGLPKSLAKPPSPPHALHGLYLLHRTSLLSVHLAEVLFALRSPKAESIHWLNTAAEASESVALALTGSPQAIPTAVTQPRIALSDAPLLPHFSKAPALLNPATSLLRDARKTAAEAWNLLGIVQEDIDKPKALECYNKALQWSGVLSQSGVLVPGVNTLQADWDLYTKNRDRVRNSTVSSS